MALRAWTPHSPLGRTRSAAFSPASKGRAVPGPGMPLLPRLDAGRGRLAPRPRTMPPAAVWGLPSSQRRPRGRGKGTAWRAPRSACRLSLRERGRSSAAPSPLPARARPLPVQVQPPQGSVPTPPWAGRTLPWARRPAAPGAPARSAGGSTGPRRFDARGSMQGATSRTTRRPASHCFRMTTLERQARLPGTGPRGPGAAGLARIRAAEGRHAALCPSFGLARAPGSRPSPRPQARGPSSARLSLPLWRVTARRARGRPCAYGHGSLRVLLERWRPPWARHFVLIRR